MKNSRYTVIAILSILFVPVFYVQSLGQAAQTTIGSVTIASPTAASLGKFADIPVSYHTGVPNIEIPLYTVQAGPLTLPISLAYHASGLKVMEPASWVGAGWALNAGGVITRTVNGQPDEAALVPGIDQYGHFSNYGYNSYFYNGGQQDWQDFALGQRDGEPDLFFFNFGGYTGKFYFRDDRTPVLVPEQDLQIIPSYSGGRSIDYFTIVTPDGTKYTFGNSPNVGSGAAPIETTNSYQQANGTTPPTSSWYLNQVETADNQFAINLTYQAENYGYYTLALFPVDAASQTGPDGIQGYGLVKNLIGGVRLSQISFPNGTVNFTAGPIRTDLCDNVPNFTEGPNGSATSLRGIQVNDGNGFCKNFQFYTSYFTGNNSALPTTLTLGNSFSSDINRLRLDSVKESSCDSSLKVPPYKFTYYSNTVPRRLSFGIDHWGYYNGQDGNTGLIPTLYVNGGTVSGATRDAAWPAMMAGMLTRIDYPTGGYRTFDFESNSAIVGTPVNSSNTLVNQILHGEIDHEGDDYPTYVSIPCTSNGNQPITYTIYTNCNFGGNIQIFDANNNPYFSTTFDQTQGIAGSQGTIIPTIYSQGSALVPFMPAGNYTIQLSLGGNPPTGGVQIEMSQPYTYETYSTVTLGGLRIKTISAADGVTSNNVVTNYSYTDAHGNSTAVLYSVPTYAMNIRNDIIANTGYWTVNGFETNPLITNGCPTTGDYLKSPGSIRPMETVQGSIVGYQAVTVSQPGNGWSTYSYYTANNGYSSFNAMVENNTVGGPCTSAIPNYPPAPLPFDSKRGELASEQHYDNSGNLLKDVYYYPTFNESPILSTPAFIAKARSVGGVVSYLGTEYSLNTVKKTSMLTIEHDYNPGATSAYVTKTTTAYYASNFHNQPTRVVTSTSTGDTLVTNTQYASDFRLAACDAISDCSTEYNNACASCQSTYNTASAACAGSSSCITTAYLNFMQCNTNARVSYVSCRNANYMGPSNAFSACHLGIENSADTLLKPVLQLQDKFMDPAVETSQWRDAFLLHSSFVGYTGTSTPTNFPYPARTQLVNLQAPSTSFTPAVVAGSSIVQDSRYLNESAYLFNNGNPWQVLPHDGVPLSYIWDYLNTEPIAKITNATPGQIAYTSFEADGTGHWTVPAGGRNTGNAFTGNNYYNLSNGNVNMSGLNSATSYVVSYWSNTNGSYSVSGTTKITQGKKINGWTYFEHTITGVTNVSVSGVDGGGGIDELRLYPANAQMTTYTYSPLLGITGQCDVDNRASYYHYDALGRLQYIQDQDGNIVKTYQYHYKGQ